MTRLAFIGLTNRLAEMSGWTLNRPTLNLAVYRDAVGAIVLVARYLPLSGRVRFRRPRPVVEQPRLEVGLLVRRLNLIGTGLPLWMRRAA